MMMNDDKKKSMISIILGKSSKKEMGSEESDPMEKEEEGYDGSSLGKELISAIEGKDGEKVYKTMKALISYCQNNHDY